MPGEALAATSAPTASLKPARLVRPPAMASAPGAFMIPSGIGSTPVPLIRPTSRASATDLKRV